MYSIKLLAVTALALSPTAMADCYGGGPDGINKAWAYNNVKGICDAYMLGYYVHGQQRHGCLTDGPNQWYFTVKLRDDVDDRSINEAECISGLQKQITECDKGGNTQYGHWIYTYVVAPSPLVGFGFARTGLTVVMIGPMPTMGPALTWTT